MKKITVKELIKQLQEYPEYWEVTLDINTDFLPEECNIDGSVRSGYYDVTGAYGFDEGEVGISFTW